MVNRATLAYREQGEGEPIVFVHGGLSDLRAWEQQLPALGRSFRAIAYSRRFARPNQDIDPEADDPMLPHVDDLAAFLGGSTRRRRTWSGTPGAPSSVCSPPCGIPTSFAPWCWRSRPSCRSS